MTERNAEGHGRLSRRRFLGLAGLTVTGAACAAQGSHQGAALGAPALEPAGPLDVGPAATLSLQWKPVTHATSYDVEVNGALVARGHLGSSLTLRNGDGGTGFVEGANVWRVRARSGGSTRWSDRSTFLVRPVGAMRLRSFDHEDDGEITLTVPSIGAGIVVGSAYAHGAGKGAALQCHDPGAASAYKNVAQQPVEECWLRLAVCPRRWDTTGGRVHLARVDSSITKAAQQIIWVTGRGVTARSLVAVGDLPAQRWSQVQLGVRADGTVELWTFDGRTEHLVGRIVDAALAGPVKDRVSLGNDMTETSGTFEVWLDDFATGAQRLPWASSRAPATVVRPRRLDPGGLPEQFSFVFGSCNSPQQVPYGNTALGAAAASDADFFVHLGDYGYPDSNAYRQTRAGYTALWSDLTWSAALSELIQKPWVHLASDHDLGGNDVDAKSLLPAATAAFAAWQNNDPSADGVGRYGSVELDHGRVQLVWTEGVAYRSPKLAPDGPDKVVLGAKQKAWLLDLLAHTRARLVILAMQTALSHVSDSDWAAYATERAQVLTACERSPAIVRIISGDYHHALWGRYGDRVAEWTAAPLAEFAEPVPVAAPLVTAHAAAAIGPGFDSRPLALAGESVVQFDAATSFGRVVVDGPGATATFEVRDSQGAIRVDASGFRFEETVRYG